MFIVMPYVIPSLTLHNWLLTMKVEQRTIWWPHISEVFNETEWGRTGRGFRAMAAVSLTWHTILPLYIHYMAGRQKAILDPFQSCFWPSLGMETILVTITNDLQKHLDWYGLVLLLILDLTAGYNTVNHHLLTDCLADWGIWGTALQWLSSFLHGQGQRVALERAEVCPGSICLTVVCCRGNCLPSA